LELSIKNFIKHIVITLLIITVSGCISSKLPVSAMEKAELNDQIKSEVLDAFHGLVAAAESFDAERYFEFFDKDKFSGLNTDGSVWHSFDSFAGLIAAGFPMMEKSISLEFSNVKVTVINASTAILVNEYLHSIKLKGGAVIEQSGGGTQVWFKANEKWQLVSVSASESS